MVGGVGLQKAEPRDWREKLDFRLYDLVEAMWETALGTTDVESFVYCDVAPRETDTPEEVLARWQIVKEQLPSFDPRFTTAYGDRAGRDRTTLWPERLNKLPPGLTQRALSREAGAIAAEPPESVRQRILRARRGQATLPAELALAVECVIARYAREHFAAEIEAAINQAVQDAA